MSSNDANPPPNDNGDNNGERRVFSETFVFTGTSGQSFLATMQNIMNRLVGGQHPQPQAQQEQQPEQQSQADPPNPSNLPINEPNPPTIAAESGPTSTGGGDPDGQRTVWNFNPQDTPRTAGDSDDAARQQSSEPHTTVDGVDHDGDTDIDRDEEMPDAHGAEDGQPPLLPPPIAPRPVRPLPRNGARSGRPAPQPHAHFHAHTPNGTIDLFTFSVAPGEEIPPPPQPGTGGGPTFTFNLGAMPGQDVLAGFEAFFLGMPSLEKEREPDIERAKVLLRGMEIVPEGLVRRLERAGGVPGGHGTEESGSAAGCAVCWGALLDEVEPGEWETALPAKEKEKTPDADEKEKGKGKEQEEAEDELHGRIIALPCAHVYHAECLLPWFSRQTTCPTCRLDIDPESLTWTPRPPRVPPPPPAQQPPSEGATNDQPPPPPPPFGNIGDGLQRPAPQPANAATDANAAEAARFTRFMNSPLLYWATPTTGDAAPAPANNPPGPQMFGPPPPPPPAPNPAQQDPHTQLLHRLMSQLPVPPQPQYAAGPPPPPPNNHPSTLNDSQPAPAGSPPPEHIMHHLPVPPQPQRPIGPLPPPLNNHPAGHPPPAHTFMPLPMFVVQPGAGPTFHHAHPHTHGPAPPRRERRKWAPPEPVGKTLRQRVEQKERELGLRCDDAVCGAAPTDEDPVPRAAAGAERVRIRAAYDAQGKACEHAFHPACLVMSARVAGVTGEEGGADTEEVQVACPTCRAAGSLQRAEWAAAVLASEAEMA